MIVLYTITINPNWLITNPTPGPISQRLVDTIAANGKETTVDELVPHDKSVLRIRIVSAIARLADMGAIFVTRHQHAAFESSRSMRIGYGVIMRTQLIDS